MRNTRPRVWPAVLVPREYEVLSTNTLGRFPGAGGQTPDTKGRRAWHVHYIIGPGGLYCRYLLASPSLRWHVGAENWFGDSGLGRSIHTESNGCPGHGNQHMTYRTRSRSSKGMPVV